MPAFSKLAISTPSDREVRFTRDFRASRQLVWDCHTKPDLMKQFKARDRSTLIMFKGAKEVGRVVFVTDATEIQTLFDKAL